MPLPKLPAYGDAAKLEQLATGTKNVNGTSGPLVQRTPAGRPPEGGTQEQPQQSVLRPEHKDVFDALAQAEVTRQQWQQVAAQSPTPWVQGMLDIAEKNYQAAAVRAYNVVPNSEF